MDRNMLGHSNYQRDLRSYSFLNGTGCLMSSNVNGRSVWFQLFLCLYAIVKTPKDILRVLLKEHIQHAWWGALVAPDALHFYLE